MTTEPAGADGGATRDGEPGVTQHRRRLGLLLTVGMVIFALDVVSKVIVVATLSDRPAVRLLGGLVYLTEARNTGAAFGLAQGMTVVFTLVPRESS